MSFAEIDECSRSTEWSMSDLHSHDYFEIYCLLKGERRYFLEDKIFDISAPTICILPPFTPHKTEGGAYRRININVSPDILSEREKRYLLDLGEHTAFKIEESKAKLFISLLEESALKANHAPGGEALTIHFVHVLISILHQDALTPYHFSNSSSAPKKDISAMRAVKYINNHFNEDFTLLELCNRIFVSKNTLCSDFRRCMHCTVMEYRTFIRVVKAKELLSSTKKSISDIAFECGFSSANYFGLIFKKSVGISPSNYRKMR